MLDNIGSMINLQAQPGPQFDYQIYFVKAVYTNDEAYLSVITRKCSVCFRFTCEMRKFVCCSKFVCYYCKDKAHLCVNFKKVSALNKEDLSSFINCRWMCCFSLSGCNEQLEYDSIMAHVEECKFKYIISDTKIKGNMVDYFSPSPLKSESEIRKYTCVFCRRLPKTLFLTSCCFRCICSKCGYRNNTIIYCVCEKKDNQFSNSIKKFTMINPVNENIEEYSDQYVFKCNYNNCSFYGNLAQVDKHVSECVEEFCDRVYSISTGPNELYNYQFSTLSEIPTFNYLEEDKCYMSDKPYPNNPTVRSILKISDDLIAIGTNVGEIDCWSESSNMRVWTTKEHSSFIYTMAKLQEDGMFISGEFTEQAVVIVWEFTNMSAVIKKKVSLENGGVWVLCVLNPDLIACGMENSNILVWDLNNKFVYKRKEENKPSGKNGKKSFKQKSSEYNSLSIKNKICTHTGYVKSLIYIKEKDLLLSGGSDCKIVTTKLSNSGFSTSELFNTEHTGIILSFCYFLEQFLASSDDNATIKIWKFEQRNSFKTIQVHLNAVTQLIYSEPKMILSSSLDKNIHFISIDNNFNFSVIKTIKTREPVWSMIHSPAQKSFTTISFNSCFITTYS